MIKKMLGKLGVYRHVKTGNLYLRLITAQTKLDGRWQPAVIYMPFPQFNRVWIRLVDNFEESFSRLGHSSDS